MRRREFISFLGGAAAMLAVAVSAQQKRHQCKKQP
jgi:hypothetical protein